MSARRTLSPRDLARAIGASESSLKRWADDGRIQVQRTAGGHRRIALSEAVRFVRETGIEVVDPAALGLTELSHAIDGEPDHEVARFQELLLAGASIEARGMLLWFFLRGRSVASLCDGPIFQALDSILQPDVDDPRELFVEHRATHICIEALYQIKALMVVEESSPNAVGCGIATDPFCLPTLMASTCVRAEGWNTANIGPDLPAKSLVLAAQESNAQLVWLTVSNHTLRDDQVREEILYVVEGLGQSGARVAIVGRSAEELLAGLPVSVFVGRNMGELAAFARGLAMPSAPG